MKFVVGHRPKKTYGLTEVEIEASSSWAAIEQVHAEIGEGSEVLFVRQA